MLIEHRAKVRLRVWIAELTRSSNRCRLWGGYGGPSHLLPRSVCQNIESGFLWKRGGAYASALVTNVLISPWSPKKNPMRTSVSTMSIREPSPGVFSSASFCASTARSYFRWVKFEHENNTKRTYLVTNSGKIVCSRFERIRNFWFPFLFLGLLQSFIKNFELIPVGLLQRFKKSLIQGQNRWAWGYRSIIRCHLYFPVSVNKSWKWETHTISLDAVQ